jgi:hypothetical protein
MMYDQVCCNLDRMHQNKEGLHLKNHIFCNYPFIYQIVFSRDSDDNFVKPMVDVVQYPDYESLDKFQIFSMINTEHN